MIKLCLTADRGEAFVASGRCTALVTDSSGTPTVFGAGYRDDPAQLTAAAPAAPALLTSPMAGETLSGGTARFTWSTGSQADRYYVAISAVDGCDLFGGDIGTALFATVASLPTDGSTVAVRLYSLLNGAWQAQDYNFTTGP